MPFSFMQGCNDRYGDCFTAAIGQKLSPVVFFSNPKALQVILTSDDSELFDAPGELNRVTRTFPRNAICNWIEW
jgi:hypothetical protein